MKKNTIRGRSVMSMEFDWFLFVLTLIISVFGVICVYSATKSYDSISNTVVQSVAAVIGAVVMVLLSRFDYEQFKNLVKPIYGVAIALLVLVLIFGVSGGWGAKSWIRIGGIGFQPAELTKICFILTFSYHLSKVEKNINKPLVLLGLIAHVGVLAALIMLEPDLGSTLVFLFMFACLLFVAKLSWKYILPVLVLGTASLPFVYKYALSDYQKGRIEVFFKPESDAMGRGYNVIQSKIAVGSGQLWGKGYLEGTQNQMGYLPAKSTDFIFSTIAEEWGFVVAAVLTVLLFVLVYRCFKVAQKADNSYGRYICVGVGAMFLFHIFENIGMCIGLMPVTGIPLPFLSYGGTSVLTNMIAVGLVLSVNYHNKPRTIVDVY